MVTGATSGIGRTVALHLARGGYQVVATARTAAKAHGLQDDARKAGVVIDTVVLDVADALSCEHAVEEALHLAHGRLTALVNNAGTAIGAALEDSGDDEARELFEVNLFGPLRLARLVLPGMRAQRYGRIINISSVAGRVPVPLLGLYSASKSALESSTEVLRMECAGWGVHAVVVAPGSFATGIWERGFSTITGIGESPYSPGYRRASRLVSATSRLPEPRPVARTVERVLRARRPRARYLAGLDCRIECLMERAAPRVVTDFAKRALTGLRAVPGREAP